jgi:hypothetical protein
VSASYLPALARVPDARRAPLPLFEPVLLAYVALLLGAPVASLLALFNAAVLRRPGPALLAAAAAAGSWLGFAALVSVLWELGARNVPLIILGGRIVHLLVGVLLAWSQWAHHRGHVFLDGREVPLLPAVLTAMALNYVLPFPFLLWLWGLPTRG